MLTRPADGENPVLIDALGHGWGLDVASLQYHPVRFGSHLWCVTDAAGQRWFLTLDDLVSKLLSSEDSHDAAFGRLTAALYTALFRAPQTETEDVRKSLMNLNVSFTHLARAVDG